VSFASWHRYRTDAAQRRSTKPCIVFGHLLGGYTIDFWGSSPQMEFCQLQNSLCVQVLHSAILAALLHGTQALGVSRTLRHGIKEWNYGTFARHFQQRVPPIFRGRPSRWAFVHMLVRSVFRSMTVKDMFCLRYFSFVLVCAHA